MYGKNKRTPLLKMVGGGIVPTGPVATLKLPHLAGGWVSAKLPRLKLSRIAGGWVSSKLPRLKLPRKAGREKGFPCPGGRPWAPDARKAGRVFCRPLN